MSRELRPQRGESWLIDFEPTIGSEIKKIRPALVISSDAINKLPIKLVSPITDWKPYFAANFWHIKFWHIKIEPTSSNGLSKTSTLDTLQLRGLDTQRFIRRLGTISEETMAAVAIAIVTVIEAEL